MTCHYSELALDSREIAHLLVHPSVRPSVNGGTFIQVYLKSASSFPGSCEDLKDTKIWDLDQLHEKLSTFEDTTYTNAAYCITGFSQRRRDAKPGAVRRRVRRLAHHYSTDFLRHFLTELEVNARDSQVKRDFQRRKRRGPTPLPKEDIKVILRPHKGLTVKNLFGSELSMAVIEACRNSFGGESFLLRVHPG
ncbi:hypothetical protein HPB51_016054 [Rhipicephalus microplus]|uniref:Uncharacterized protein n=1 Tax=Rhipicephalus microplus TaxID=6941 RepID=A0A9J6DI24_RHIMP|nr:hypothetical protein HPB51_016054 [Rhipicephalus microplus]